MIESVNFRGVEDNDFAVTNNRSFSVVFFLFFVKIFFAVNIIHRNIAILIKAMGITRTDIFSRKQNKLATVLKALAHPARIAILQQIIKANACICNDLVQELGLAQATISQHLKELKNIGIIKGSIEGTSVCYCIDEKVWAQIGSELSTFFGRNVKVNDCC